MKKSIVFLIVLNWVTSYHCCGMDTPVTILHNGLKTEIRGVIVQTKESTIQNFTGTIIVSKNYKNDTLENLIKYQTPTEQFWPRVIKLDGNKHQDLGFFDRNKHLQALNAIYHNQALYYAHATGMIIYSCNAQPDPEICAAIRISSREIPLQKNT